MNDYYHMEYMLSSIKKQDSQCALTHFQSRRCSWGAGPRSSPASPSRPRWRRWWSRWSRRGGGSRGTSLLSSFWSVGTLLSSEGKEGVCVIEASVWGLLKKEEEGPLGDRSHVTRAISPWQSQAVISILGILKSAQRWATSRSGEVQSSLGWVDTGAK